MGWSIKTRSLGPSRRSQTLRLSAGTHQSVEDGGNQGSPEHHVVSIGQLWSLIMRVKSLIGRARFEVM